MPEIYLIFLAPRDVDYLKSIINVLSMLRVGCCGLWEELFKRVSGNKEGNMNMNVGARGRDDLGYLGRKRSDRTAFEK